MHDPDADRKLECMICPTLLEDRLTIRQIRKDATDKVSWSII